MNDLTHLRRSIERPSGFVHSNWCLEVEKKIIGCHGKTIHSAPISRDLEVLCKTCQHRFLHKITGHGCHRYGVTYEEREEQCH